MSTIAYRDGVLVSDSHLSADDTRWAFGRKLAECAGFIGGAVGDLRDYYPFLQWIEAGCTGTPPSDCKVAEGLCIARDGSTFLWDGTRAVLMPIDGPFFAMGSGANFALGAMAHGASAIDAVKCAIELDNASGGPLHVISLTAEVAHAAHSTRSLTHPL